MNVINIIGLVIGWGLTVTLAASVVYITWYVLCKEREFLLSPLVVISWWLALLMILCGVSATMEVIG